jgi:hypothetical protein
MIDQRFMDSLAQDLKMSPEQLEEEGIQLASANTGVTTDGGAYVGYRMNMPKGLNTRENQAKQSALIANTLGGGTLGAGAAGVGLAGDIVDIILMGANALGADMPEKSGIWTTEDVTSWLASKGINQENISGLIDKALPSSATEEEKARAFGGGQTIGEIAAPGTQLSLIGKAGKEIVKGGAKVGKKIIEAGKDLPVGMSIKMVDGTEQVLEKAPKIESKAFKNWFGESKVVDEANKPIVVYHGTKDDIDQFMQGKPNKKDAGWLGDGFYFTDNPELASTYAEYLKSGPEGANVLPVYLSIKNPYEATMKDKEYLMMADRRGDKVALKEFTDNLIKQGYDGVVLDYKKQMGVTEPVKEYVAFKPEQIKSVFNKGEFNPQDPRILYGSGVSTGAAMFQEENQ